MGKKRRGRNGFKESNYFTRSIIGFPLKEANIGRIKKREIIFQKINSSKPNRHHSANEIYQDNKGRIVAIRCNCGKDTFHPVYDFLPNWEENLSHESLVMLRGGN